MQALLYVVLAVIVFLALSAAITVMAPYLAVAAILFCLWKLLSKGDPD